MSTSSDSNPLRNFLLRIAYDGTDFFGWQIQPQLPTIQGALTAALEALCGEPAHVCGAGRTDAGVHAEEQAASFRLRSPIPCPNLVGALNDHLPESIRVLSAQEAPLEFHARRDARSKIYRYRMYRGALCPPALTRYVYPFPYPLDEAAMAEAAPLFAGTWDFRPFTSANESAGEENRSTVRTVFSSHLERRGEELHYTIEGNGFLYHMVRNIMGMLILAGRHRIEPPAIRELLAGARPAVQSSTAPARGLHLVRVLYPAEPRAPAPRAVEG